MRQPIHYSFKKLFEYIGIAAQSKGGEDVKTIRSDRLVLANQILVYSCV